MKNLHQTPKRRTYIQYILISILVLGATLRLFGFTEKFGWWGDIARDYLIGNHIINYGEFPLVGPTATGLNGPGGYFYYPPYYYYLIAILEFFFRSPEALVFINIVFNIFAIYIIYDIGILLFSPAVGLMTAFIYAISPRMAIQSKMLVSAYTVLPLFLLSVRLFIKSYKVKNFNSICMSMLMLSFAASLYYSILILLPVFLSLAIFRFRSAYASIAKLLILTFLFNGLLYAPLIKNFGISQVIMAFLPGRNIELTSSFFATLSRQIHVYFKNIFIICNEHSFTVWLITVIMLLAILTYRKKLNATKLLPFLFFPLYVLVFGAIRQTEALTHYYYIMEPAVFFISSYIIIKSVQLNQSRLLKYATLLISIVMILCFRNNINDLFYTNNSFKEMDIISDKILSLNKQALFTDAYTVILSAKYDWSWESPTIWYFLEKKEKQKIVNVVNYGEGLEPINVKSKYWILICKDREINWQHVCVSNFLTLKPNSTLFARYPKQGMYLEQYALYFFHF